MAAGYTPTGHGEFKRWLHASGWVLVRLRLGLDKGWSVQNPDGESRGWERTLPDAKRRLEHERSIAGG